MSDAPAPSICDLHDLSGKVAFVTGAANGIGLASARRLAEAGARIFCFDTDTAGAAAMTVELGGPERARAVTGDVRRRDEVRRAVADAVDAWGGIDIVVNSAGLFPPSPWFAMTDELWDTVVDTNASGTFLVSQLCARAMAEAGRPGAIVNIASKSALQPTAGFVHYAASKGAVAMITKALALELAPHQIRVNAVAPGSVATETAAKVGAAVVANAAQWAAEQPGPTPERTDAVARGNRCPMGRSATADEIARVVLFLASEWSAYMTGSIVLADGGFLVS